MNPSIFVFGSNLAGRHGAGAARTARLEHGAQYGIGEGRTGNSYAIPTLDGRLQKLQLSRIEQAVDDFIDYTWRNEKLNFFVTRIGCGLAGFKDSEIAPMFRRASPNCILPIEWKPYLDDDVCAQVSFHRWDEEQQQARLVP